MENLKAFAADTSAVAAVEFGIAASLFLIPTVYGMQLIAPALDDYLISTIQATEDARVVLELLKAQ